MTPEQRQGLRMRLKECRAFPKAPEYAEQADILNRLLPAMVDRMTDEEIEEAFVRLDIRCEEDGDTQ